MSQIMNPEASRRFGEAVLEAVGASDEHVLDGTVVVEIDSSSSSTGSVRWESGARISREKLAEILEGVNSVSRA
jgi:hypothetical protein